MPASDPDPHPAPARPADPVQLGWEALCLHRAIDDLRQALDVLAAQVDRVLERAIQEHRTQHDAQRHTQHSAEMDLGVGLP